MQQRIAFFDFDGTITTKDTLLEFIKYSKGSFRLYLGFLLNSPWLAAYKLKLISNHRAKERVLGYFFRNMPLDIFQKRCDQFAATIIPGLVRPKALQEISRLQESGATIVIVSASPENWIRGWAGTVKADLIATRLESTGDSRHLNGNSNASTTTAERLTGRIKGLNCHGEEKVRCIQQSYQLSNYDEVYAYGDTKGDRPMLQLASHGFYKPFR